LRLFLALLFGQAVDLSQIKLFNQQVVAFAILQGVELLPPRLLLDHLISLSVNSAIGHQVGIGDSLMNFEVE